MSKTKKIGRRALAIILSVALMLTTFVTLNIGSLVGSAQATAITVTENAKENVYFYVLSCLFLLVFKKYFIVFWPMWLLMPSVLSFLLTYLFFPLLILRFSLYHWFSVLLWYTLTYFSSCLFCLGFVELLTHVGL